MRKSIRDMPQSQCAMKIMDISNCTLGMTPTQNNFILNIAHIRKPTIQKWQCSHILHNPAKPSKFCRQYFVGHICHENFFIFVGRICLVIKRPELQKRADRADQSVLFFWPVLIFGKSTRKTGESTRKQVKKRRFFGANVFGEKIGRC